MAIRFLESNYFKSPFVRGLKGASKVLYSFIICDCTPSGIWCVDMEAASLYTGFPQDIKTFEEDFVNTGKAIKTSNGKYFFPDFIEHQYPSGLQENNKAHKNIIIELKKLNLLDDCLIVIKGASKGLQSPPSHSHSHSQGKGHSQGKDKTELFFKTTMPLATDFNGLPEIKLGSVIQLFKITKQTEISADDVGGLWHIFKDQNLTGKKYYADEDAVYSHFINWCKTQKIEKNGADKTRVESAVRSNPKSAGQYELLERIKKSYGAGK